MISGVSNNVAALRDAQERVGRVASSIANQNPQNVDGGEEVPPVESTDETKGSNERDDAGEEVVRGARDVRSNDNAEEVLLAQSIGEMIEAKMELGANIAVIKTQDEMLGTLLDAFG